jgi:tetratricopeptide (TPR) repeat protein
VSDSPKPEPKDIEIPKEAAEMLIRGEMSLGEFLGLSREKLYGFANQAYQLLQAGQASKAAEIYEGLVAAAPTDSVFHGQLGATYMTLERFDDAFEAYSKALQFNDANVDALVGRGEIYLRRSMVPEALKDLAAAIQYDPELKRAATRRAHGTLLALKVQAEQAKAGTAAPEAPKK